MQTIGTGIRNGAVHEASHQFDVIFQSMGGFLHSNPPFPYQHCGLANSSVACQNGNNYVYSFGESNGQWQDPTNPNSAGASFFYLNIPGHPIHFGPDQVCWLINWTGPGTCEF
jgi:hypothetical protein